MQTHAIKTLLGFLRPYPSVLPVVAVLGVAASLAEGIGIGLLIPFLALLLEHGPPAAGLVTEITAGYAALFPENLRLAVVATTIVTLVVLVCGIQFAYFRLLSWVGTRVADDLRTRLFRQFLLTNDLFLERGAQGRQMNALEGSCYRVSLATINVCLMIVNGTTALVFILLMALIAWPLTLVVLVGGVAIGVVLRWATARCVATGRRLEESNAALSETALQTLTGLRMIRIFGQEGRETERFTTTSGQLRELQFTLEFAWRAMAPLVDLLSVPLLIGTLVIAWSTGYGLMILLPFLFLAFRLQRYAREFDVARVRFAANAMAVVEVTDQLARTAVTELPSGRRPFNGLQDRIVFDRVSFTHKRDDAALRAGGDDAERRAVANVSLEIHKGETLAIVGGSGAGKSTLINLLCRIYDPTAGEIRIDGVPLGSFDLASWRRGLGFAGQDAELTPATIAENIAYGDPGASRDAVIEAARLANVDHFIATLPAGYDTPVGVRGMQLSGGERQRIALARALLRKPAIMILDEATNALDNLTEAAIQKTLGDLAGRMTLIIIAHRLSTTRLAERVAVMNAGRLVEVGRREDLLERPGLFAELHGLELGQAAD